MQDAFTALTQNRGNRQAVPNSTGTEPPKLRAPANSADCHIHIYDPRFPPQVEKPSNGTAQHYRLLQKRIGVTRVVIVTTWAPDEATRHRILVTNPEALYDFPK